MDFTINVEEGREPIVLQLTDTQIVDAAQERTPDRLGADLDEYWATDKIDARCFDYVKETITATNPDLILLTGDLIYGCFDDNGSAFLNLVDFMESFGIPWAPVFGNHDGETEMGVDWICENLENAPNCLFKQRTLSGNGNYTVGLVQGGELKRVFFMLDSNGCYGMNELSLSNGHCRAKEGFGADQVIWYTGVAKKITAVSPKTKISFAFHIQPLIFQKAYEKYGFTNTDTKANPINIDTHEDQLDSDFGYLGRDLKHAWDKDYSIFNGMKALGTDSIFVGHEHCNSASVVYDGIRFQYGQKSSTYDRANYITTDGRIEGSYIEIGTPIVGGTVIKLSETDGSISDAYIYYCKITKDAMALN